ncbi:MAG TPA: imidazolonepropionase [Thermoanaerobaculia bacterium]|nr:imidazolonepropionase [Thermoanaerobaculia bacterium]
MTESVGDPLVLRDIAQLWSAGESVRDSAIAWRDGRILWVGAESDLSDELAAAPSRSAGGALVVPGLVDCHTHLCFGGWREDEFAEKLAGVPYLEIAKRGGGIARTMRQTREASKEELVAKADRNLAAMRALGVTTVEAKSGYGLSYEHEIRQLEVYAALSQSQPTRIVPTLLAAHVVPPEHRDDRAGYLDLILERLLPEVAARGLARFCDVFVEETAFSIDEARRVLEAGQRHGLDAKLHADQITDGGGALLAAELGAASADHLERISPAGIARLVEAGVVAVSLPLATAYLGQEPPPVRAMIAAGVTVAVATDYNPGSAPSYDLQLAIWLACVRQRMTPSEALLGATLHAARALRLDGEVGSLEPGRAADLVLVDAPSVEHWLYHFRPDTVLETWIAGERVYRRPGREEVQ